MQLFDYFLYYIDAAHFLGFFVMCMMIGIDLRLYKEELASKLA